MLLVSGDTNGTTSTENIGRSFGKLLTENVLHGQTVSYVSPSHEDDNSTGRSSFVSDSCSRTVPLRVEINRSWWGTGDGDGMERTDRGRLLNGTGN